MQTTGITERPANLNLLNQAQVDKLIEDFRAAGGQWPPNSEIPAEDYARIKWGELAEAVAEMAGLPKARVLGAHVHLKAASREDFDACPWPIVSDGTSMKKPTAYGEVHWFTTKEYVFEYFDEATKISPKICGVLSFSEWRKVEEDD